MTIVMVDIEADGPIPGDYSMVSLGAVIVDRKLDKTFYGELKPISEQWQADALEVCDMSRDQTLTFNEPVDVMREFRDWLQQNCKSRPLFYSDNNGFDWQFVNWYFWHFLNQNPFGHSSTNLGSLYKGMVKDTFKNFKHLRKTVHSHHPVDDALGNAEALLYMKDEMQLSINVD